VKETTTPTARREARLDRGLLLLLTPLLWGATFPAAKLGLESMHPFAFMAWTRILGVVTIALALWWLRGEGADRDTLRRVAWPAVVLGALIFAGYTLQTLGLEITTATNAGFITGLYVVLVPLLAMALFREAAGRAAWVAVAVSVVGLGLLSTDSVRAFEPRPGDLLVLAGALAWAGHVVALSRLAPRFPVRLLSLAQLVTTVIFHLVAAAFVGLEADEAARAWHLLVVTGVLGTGVAYTLQIVAQRGLTPARAAVILSGESLAAALISIVWLGERLAPHQWLGAALIIAAMVISELGARRGVAIAPEPT
jgi:drug/metabolite transporter (DMT)-like permease